MNRLISSGVTVVLSLLIVACSSPHTLDVRVSQSNYKDVEIASSTPNEPLRMWANEAPDFLYSSHN
ncbi:patatin family protein, partial [Vibrio alginolyticus]